MKQRAGLLLLMTLLGGCGAPDDGDIQWHNDREYTLTVYGPQQQPLLRAEVSYLGRTPPQTELEPGWRPGITDFYRTRLQNLSSDELQLLEIRYHMAKGPLHTRPVKDGDAILSDYGDNLLRPGESLTDRDSFVWAKDDNTLHRVFVIVGNGRQFDVDIPLRYLH